MKKLFIILFLFLPAFSLMSSNPGHTCTVRIRNITNAEGQLVIALFDNENDFLKKPFISKTLTIKGDALNCTFQIPEGDYAISIFHDKNGNKKLDKNWMGIPTEPIGFGNNYKPLGPPDFKSSTVRFSTENNKTEIQLYTIF